ncbi:MAG: hypothetical protein A2W00_06270 [Candidatus Eisenbacteria bacterium RBG_16_71_46]|nr:MAG: hypothetical protein A2W00_06270 [Candidatus Eisenbacteria bacterium RBG_16_71_46]OGF23611.1 MAG: hypothetical protein A2V63_07795 [Candidatus Eisenbacteria bacterium RBG_19FT_COMBO_70_11]
MTAPELLRFRTQLDCLLADARRRGSLELAEYESVLLDPGFDDDEFERFRVSAARSGIALPEDREREAEVAPPAGPATRGAASVADPEFNLLDRYLSEIGRISLLAHADLLRLARKSRAGDTEARKQIILANLRLVVHVARGYRNRGVAMLDLIEEGNLGLIHAVDRFQPERGLRFSTYAAIWIRQSILRGISEQSRSVRIPVQMLQQVNRYMRAERALRASLGREPDADEVGGVLEISPARARRLAGLISGLRSLDEGSSMEAFEQLSTDALSEAPPSVERLVELQLEHEKIGRLLRSLAQREEQILRIRYGFHDGVARTLAQTGQHFGISRERVRQIEARALDKLRRAIEMHDLDRTSGSSHP